MFLESDNDEYGNLFAAGQMPHPLWKRCIQKNPDRPLHPHFPVSGQCPLHPQRPGPRYSPKRQLHSYAFPFKKTLGTFGKTVSTLEKTVSISVFTEVLSVFLPCGVLKMVDRLNTKNDYG